MGSGCVAEERRPGQALTWIEAESEDTFPRIDEYVNSATTM